MARVVRDGESGGDAIGGREWPREDAGRGVGGATIEQPTYRIARYPVALIDRLHLADGRSVLVRPVLPQDAGALQEFVRRLSLASRYRRFHMGVRELPPAVLRAFTEVDYATHLGLVA